ncbi:MAG: hypothetical protein HC831_09530 [Chloroflexia bacterium]|nr:hypothetical protein [Chloroflexia bacterium]
MTSNHNGKLKLIAAFIAVYVKQNFGNINNLTESVPPWGYTLLAVGMFFDLG